VGENIVINEFCEFFRAVYVTLKTEVCHVGWRTGKVRCSIPSKIAGHKSSSAKGDRAISSKESAFVMTAGETFLPIGTRKKIRKNKLPNLFALL